MKCFKKKSAILTLKMKIVISFLIFLALADGVPISNVEVETDGAVISKVEVETDAVKSKHCTGSIFPGMTGMVYFGLVWDILSIFLMLSWIIAPTYIPFNKFFQGFHAGIAMAGGMEHIMEDLFCTDRHPLITSLNPGRQAAGLPLRGV